MNAWGDQTGHSAARAAASMAVLAAITPAHAPAAAILHGDGTAEIRRFVAWARSAGIRVIGGLPTGFADVPIPAATLAAIRAVYLEPPGPAGRVGSAFLTLPNHARYPRSSFFDTPDHLHEDAQRQHARLVADALVAARLLD
jgi:hypothetical protein